MTTPKIIGHLHGCGELNRRDQRRMAADTYLGGLDPVDSFTMEDDDPIRDALKHVLKPAGYRVMTNSSRCHPYDPWSYVAGMGSVLCHDDPGMGLQAAVLVAALPLTRGGFLDSWCQFTSRGQWLDCHVGTVFVFNGDQPHAWLANCRWCLATHSIRRIRNRHTAQRRTAEQLQYLSQFTPPPTWSPSPHSSPPCWQCSPSPWWCCSGSPKAPSNVHAAGVAPAAPIAPSESASA